MKKLCLLILVLVIAAGVNAQQTKPASSTPVGDTTLQRKADTTKQEFLKVTLQIVLITKVSAPTTSGTPQPAFVTKENITTVTKGLKIENGKLTTADGYQFVLSKDEKSALLQKISSTGLSTVVGTVVCNCYGNSSTCMVTITDNRIISLSNDCEDCLLNATVNNAKYLIKLN